MCVGSESNASKRGKAQAGSSPSRRNLEGLEEDTDGLWRGRRELVEQLVERVTVGRTEDDRAKVDIACEFALSVQAASGVTDDRAFEIPAGDTPIREGLAKA